MDRDVAVLSSLVDDLFLLSRLEEGSVEMERGPIDITELADEAIEMLTPVAVSAEVQLELVADLRVVAVGGSEAVSRVLRNLLDNAIEATDAPGRVEVSAAKNNGSLQIAVADTGSGIPAEAKEKLFLPHFSTKRRGTGLGLAIVDNLMRLHGGTVRIESEEGFGTTVRLLFPADIVVPQSSGQPTLTVVASRT